MNSSLRIAAITHDVGGTRAVIPILREAHAQGSCVHALVAGPGTAVWTQEARDLPSTVVEDGLSDAQADRLLIKSKADVLLSASGLYNDSEHTLRRAAARLAIPCVAVLDSWLNYRERFERYRQGRLETSWPKKICAIDQLTLRGILATGFPATDVLVTGPSNLEANANASRRAIQDSRSAWRKEEGLQDDDLVVVFFSDPFYMKPDGHPFKGIGGLFDSHGRSLFGYTSTQTLEMVLDHLEKSCRRHKRRLHFIIKPHPLEWSEALQPVLKSRSSDLVTILMRKEGNPTRWIVIADVVIGMMSIALLEAALAGRPALSVEIGLKESGAEEACVSNDLGYTRGIFKASELEQVAENLATGRLDALRNTPHEPLPLEGASKRVVEVLEAACACRPA